MDVLQTTYISLSSDKGQLYSFRCEPWHVGKVVLTLLNEVQISSILSGWVAFFTYKYALGGEPANVLSQIDISIKGDMTPAA